MTFIAWLYEIIYNMIAPYNHNHLQILTFFFEKREYILLKKLNFQKWIKSFQISGIFLNMHSCAPQWTYKWSTRIFIETYAALLDVSAEILMALFIIVTLYCRDVNIRGDTSWYCPPIRIFYTMGSKNYFIVKAKIRECRSV